MSELVVLVVEDEPEVRDAIIRDLDSYGDTVRVVESESFEDALVAIQEIESAGDDLGLVLADHRLPGRTGVDLLVMLQNDPTSRRIRKVLITGQAGQEDTIRAINKAGLNRYIAKPWDAGELRVVVTEQLTDFVIESGLDPLPFVRDLDGPRLLEAFAERGLTE